MKFNDGLMQEKVKDIAPEFTSHEKRFVAGTT